MEKVLSDELCPQWEVVADAPRKLAFGIIPALQYGSAEIIDSAPDVRHSQFIFNPSELVVERIGFLKIVRGIPCRSGGTYSPLETKASYVGAPAFSMLKSPRVIRPWFQLCNSSAIVNGTLQFLYSSLRGLTKTLSGAPLSRLSSNTNLNSNCPSPASLPSVATMKLPG